MKMVNTYIQMGLALALTHPDAYNSREHAIIIAFNNAFIILFVWLHCIRIWTNVQPVSVNNATGRIECSISNKKDTHTCTATHKNTHVLGTCWNPFGAFLVFSHFELWSKAKIVPLPKLLYAHELRFILVFGIILRAS